METKDRTVTVAVITGIVALLLGCCLGAMIGGVGGLAIGRQARNLAYEQYLPTAPALPVVPARPGTPATPTPRLPGMRGVSGAVIGEVVAGSPAEEAGLSVGDVITAVGNTPVDANHRLVDILGQYKPGDQVTLKVRRLGNTVTVKATLGENPDSKGRPYLGVRYTDFPIPDATPVPSD
jgi:membrane-associated protease RseP (regulator of RpoE activity)